MTSKQEPAKVGDLVVVSGHRLVLLFVVAVVVFALYALVRPFTHFRYLHLDEQLWKPLD